MRETLSRLINATLPPRTFALVHVDIVPASCLASLIRRSVACLGWGQRARYTGARTAGYVQSFAGLAWKGRGDLLLNPFDLVACFAMKQGRFLTDRSEGRHCRH